MFVQVALLQKGDSFVRTQLDVSLSIISDLISHVTRDIPSTVYMNFTVFFQAANFNFVTFHF